MISYTLPTIGEAEEAVKGMEELGDLQENNLVFLISRNGFIITLEV